MASIRCCYSAPAPTCERERVLVFSVLPGHAVCLHYRTTVSLACFCDWIAVLITLVLSVTKLRRKGSALVCVVTGVDAVQLILLVC